MIKSNNSAKFSVEDYQFQSFSDVPEDHAEVKTFEFQNFFNNIKKKLLLTENVITSVFSKDQYAPIIKNFQKI